MEGASVSGAVLPAPIGVDSFWQPRRAAFWVLLFFLANGLYSVIGMGLSGHAVVPQGMWTAVAVWTLYALPFLLLLRMLDLSVQISTVALVLAFAWGGLGAVYLAVPANDAILALAAKLGSPEFRSSWGAAIAGPTTEELLKYVGMVLLVLVARTQFLTPLAIVVTGAMVGLGFQIVEDFVYSINAAAGASDDDQVGPVLSMLLVRGFLCGLWSHAVYTAVTSFGLAQFLLRTDLSFAARLGRAVLFFALGWALHAAWNSPLLHELADAGPLGAFAFIFIKGLPVLAVGLWIWRLALHEQARYLSALATALVPDPRLIAPAERDSLCSLGSRRAARKTLRRQHGRAAARALHALQRVQIKLLLSLGRWGDGPRAARWAERVHAARARLAPFLS